MAHVRGWNYEIDDHFGYIPEWDLCRGGWNLVNDDAHVKAWEVDCMKRAERDRVQAEKDNRRRDSLHRAKAEEAGMSLALFQKLFLQDRLFYELLKQETYYAHGIKDKRPFQQVIAEEYDCDTIRERLDGRYWKRGPLSDECIRWVNAAGFYLKGQRRPKPRKLPVQTAWETYQYAA